MIPVGYMYKTVSLNKGLPAKNVVDIFSAGECGAGLSPPFADFIQYWKHNGYWFFNSPEVIQEIAHEHNLDLSGMTLFYYETYELECEICEETDFKPVWVPFEPEASFITNVVPTDAKQLAGFDVVEYQGHNSTECSLLSCSHLSANFVLNSHCLFETFEQAYAAIESGKFHWCEPGPYRIIAVYTV